MESYFEEKLISSNKNENIAFLKSHPEYFNEAIGLAISNKQPYAWRSAFLLFSCIEENDKRVKKFIKSIISAIKNKKDGHQRELLKILFKFDIDEKYEGYLFDTCINLWEQIDKKPSVRVTALKFIIKIVKKHPELLDEINFLTQEHFLATLSPGIKLSVKKMLSTINKKHSTNFILEE